jgi:dephospho-CoA kinase
MKKIIIGVTGTFCAGKDTVADYLVEKGFFYLSLSDLVREECLRRKCYNGRDDLIRVANELRQNNGYGILAKMALEKVKEKEKIVIGSIRNPGEVEEFKKNTNFLMINVDAPIEIRYKRAQQRGKVDDEVSFEKFKAQEDFERKGNDSQQQLDKVASMANYTVINDGTIEELNKKINQIIIEIKK